MKPVRLDVIAPTLEGLGICAGCEIVLAEAGVARSPTERALDELPPEWQSELRRLSAWVYELAEQYGARVQIRVIDPQSPEGLVKSIRYRVRSYPTWTVGRRARIAGWDRAAVDAALRAAVAQEAPYA